MDVRLVCLSIVSIVVNTCRGEEVCCGDVGCFDDNFPYEWVPLPECSVVVETKFLLFTRENPTEGVAISHDSIPELYKKGEPVAYLSHGFFSSSKIQWVISATEILLDAYDINVIAIDWEYTSKDILYPLASSNTRVVGATAARLAKVLANTYGTHSSSQWCVGHSLGAHTCGHLGKKFKIGRITGSDPAGPFNECQPEEAHLNRNDADFVDVIHTNGKDSLILDLGTMKPMGHIDFYPNDGGVQPGCYNRRKRSLPIKPTRRDCMNIIQHNDILEDIKCSHSRAYEIWFESFKCRFRAQKECTDAWKIPNTCSPCVGDCPVLGPNAIQSNRTGIFTLKTGGPGNLCPEY